MKLLTLNLSIEKNDPIPRNSTVSKEQPIKDKQDLISQYPECFNGVGKFQGEYHIVLDPNVPAVVHPPRRMPISLKDNIKRELDKMANSDIIANIKEGQPTQRVNSLVYHRKQNGRLRLCLDLKDLNAAIQREHHATPTLEEILPKLQPVAKRVETLRQKTAHSTIKYSPPPFQSCVNGRVTFNP